MPRVWTRVHRKPRARGARGSPPRGARL